MVEANEDLQLRHGDRYRSGGIILTPLDWSQMVHKRRGNKRPEQKMKETKADGDEEKIVDNEDTETIFLSR